MNGDDLLYRFFNEVLPRDEELFHRVPAMLLESMAIWMPIDLYAELPVLLPWVVRDASCRGNRKAGRPDAWGSPNALGYLRDDNSLIKSIPKALDVRGPGHLRGARMGTEFVASHIWRVVQHDDLASRIPLLNSFVPNLVWLPAQVAKLTDREGGIVQKTLQAMSRSIYESVPVRPELRAIVEKAWSLLPRAEVEVPPFDRAALNWFEASVSFIDGRRAKIADVVAGLEVLESGRQLEKKVITTRYTAGLPEVSPESRRALLDELRRHLGVH